jgi:3-oxoacyl-[acyl-carrier-protein] synthase II
VLQPSVWFLKQHEPRMTGMNDSKGDMSLRKVLITGVGMITGLGQGMETHVAAVREGRAPVVDTERFAPYPVHPLGSVELDSQIPKKSDQRQMEPWQRLGVYAAGLALDSAGIKNDIEIKQHLQLIVAAGGGERDHAVDAAVLNGLKSAANPGAYLNERLMSDLRPTLFLAQLSNLLAGNISIVHGVTGASRTFMGEEQAGVDAVRNAQARIAAGQAEIILVGGAYNAERQDMMLLFEMGGMLRHDEYAPVFVRDNKPGMITGSAGAFLVLESEAHAAARNAVAIAELGPVQAGRAKRAEPGAVKAMLQQLIARAGQAELAISAATGIAGITSDENTALDASSHKIAIGDLAGHAVEAAFPLSVALAAALVQAGEAPDALVTGVGHWRGEGAVRVMKTQGRTE